MDMSQDRLDDDDKGHTFVSVVRLRKETGEKMCAEAAFSSVAVLTEVQILFCINKQTFITEFLTTDIKLRMSY
jgi:hypothetical protein